MKPISNINEIETDQIASHNYDSNGLETSDENQSIARIVNSESSLKYFIKTNKITGSLFNPIKDNLKDRDRRLRSTESILFQMKPVNKKTFDVYLESLRTKNSYLYQQANIANK